MSNRPFIRNLLLTLALVLVGTALYVWTPERFNLLAELLVRFAMLALGIAVLVEAPARKTTTTAMTGWR